MTNEFETFQRKTFTVRAARVTVQNIDQLARECGGRLMHDGPSPRQKENDYIKVRVQYPLNDDQTKARIGDWLVKQGRNWKVYKDKAFRNTFEYPDGTQVAAPEQPKKQNGGPSPAQMPKKRAEAPITSETVEVPVVNPEPVQEEAVATETPVEAPQETFQETPETTEVVTDGTAGPKTLEALAEESPVLESENSPAEDSGETPLQEQSFEPASDETVPEERKPITLDELNEMPGDPRSTQEIMRGN